MRAAVNLSLSDVRRFVLDAIDSGVIDLYGARPCRDEKVATKYDENEQPPSGEAADASADSGRAIHSKMATII